MSSKKWISSFFRVKRRGDGVHGGVAPALVKEPAVLVELREVVDVGFGAQPVEVADFEIGPLGARIDEHEDR